MRAHQGSLAVQVKYATEKQKLNCSNELSKWIYKSNSHKFLKKLVKNIVNANGVKRIIYSETAF